MSHDKDAVESLLSPSDRRRIFKRLGFDLKGRGPNADGWVNGVLGPKSLGEGKRANFSVNLVTGAIIDHGSSGYSGDLYDAVRKVKLLSFPEAVRWVATTAGVSDGTQRTSTPGPHGDGHAGDTPRSPEPAEEDNTGPVEADGEPDPVVSPDTVIDWRETLMGDSHAAEAARSYLTEERGLHKYLLEGVNIGLSQNSGTYDGAAVRWWIVIPVPDRRSEDGTPVVAIKAFAFNPEEKDWRRDSGGNKILRAKGSALYNVVSSDEPFDAPVLVCEGELDALCALAHEFNAVTGTAGASTFKKKWASQVASLDPAQEHGVVIAYDGDEAGRNGAERAAGQLYEAGLDIRVAPMPDGKDVSDLLTSGGRKALKTYLQEARPYSPGPEIGVLASDVESQSTEWLWKPWLPVGELTILDGDPGLGKSTLACELAGRLTTGRQLPTSNRGTDPKTCGVVLVGAEDSPSRTVKPRLQAAGANLNRVRIVETVPVDGEEGDRPLVLPNDRDLVKQTIRQTGAQLVVIDPLMAHLAEEVNPHRDQDVRQALTPLSTLAEEEEVAVLVIRHLNKSGDQTPKYRGQGSIGFIGQARVAWLMAGHPKDEEKRVIAHTKNNLAPPPSSRAFRLEESKTHDAVRILWDGTVDLSASDLLGKTGSNGRGRKPKKLERAKGWLQAQLADGPVKKSKLTQEAETEDISERTLERAKSELSIESFSDEYQGEYKWRLPQNDNSEDDN